MTKVLSGVALEQAATRAAHYRSPPNPHEKIAEGTRRVVLALAYKDGYKDCAEAAHDDYQALEEDHAELRAAYDSEYQRSHRLEAELASLRAKVGDAKS